MKENINDRLHVYRTAPGTEKEVVTDTLDVDADLRVQLRDTFPEDMIDFIVRFEAELGELEAQTAASTEVVEVRDLLNQAKAELAKGGETAYVEAERLVEEAVDLYLTLQVQAS